MKRSPDIPCIPSQYCPEANTGMGCREDTHHIYQWGEADTRTKKLFAQLWVNKLVLCRAVHTSLEREFGWPEFPDNTEMEVQIRRYRGRDGTDRGA